MNEWMTLSHMIWTVVVFVVFLGIIGWAWSGQNKEAFDKAAREPLDDSDAPSINQGEFK
jgi:cbb3-type cytochrome oxidase subunit 3